MGEGHVTRRRLSTARAGLALLLAAWVGAGCDCVRGRPLSMDCIDVDGHRVCRTALTPSESGAGIDDVFTLFSGRGDDYACRPEKAADLKHGLLVHLVGTGDDPSAADGFAERACAAGFAAVAPMYENRKASRQVCGALDGADADACFEAFHREILFGDGAVDVAGVSVDDNNAVRNRTQKLLDALAGDDGDAFPPWKDLDKAFADGDMSAMTLSGHSQGNGHALFWAREQEVARVVLLSGVADAIGLGTPSSVPPAWIAGFQDLTATDPQRFFSFVHQDEDGLTPVDTGNENADDAGVPPVECLWPASPLPAGCHRVVVRPMGCGPVDAHISVVTRTWGDKCQLGGDGHDNGPTWESLLTGPG